MQDSQHYEKNWVSFSGGSFFRCLLSDIACYDTCYDKLRRAQSVRTSRVDPLRCGRLAAVRQIAGPAVQPVDSRSEPT